MVVHDDIEASHQIHPALVKDVTQRVKVIRVNDVKMGIQCVETFRPVPYVTTVSQHIGIERRTHP